MMNNKRKKKMTHSNELYIKLDILLKIIMKICNATKLEFMSIEKL